MKESISYFMTEISGGVFLLLLSTIVFDVLHFVLHKCANSSNASLRAAGAIHQVHHRFLDTDLHIHQDLIAANVWCHVIPEFLVQVIVTCLLGVFFSVSAVAIALGLELLAFLLIIKPVPGFDINHHPVEKLKAYRPLYFCVPEYHFLHHAYPDAYFSSWIKTLDHLLGTGVSLKGRHVTLTGTNTAFGKQLANKLQQAGCHLIPDDLKSESLKTTDILVLCHDPISKTDYPNIIETYYQANIHRRTPVEIWVLSWRGEFSTPETAVYARFARQLFTEKNVIYRHLVAHNKNPDSDSANNLFHNIKKGFNYVPERWSLSLLKHYGQFVLK